jgi:hypothetical protein
MGGAGVRIVDAVEPAHGTALRRTLGGSGLAVPFPQSAGGTDDEDVCVAELVGCARLVGVGVALATHAGHAFTIVPGGDADAVG